MVIGKRKRQHHLYIAFKIIFLGIVLILTLFPFYWILITSFKNQKEIFSLPITYWPRQFSLENYRYIFSIGNFGKYVLNSAFVGIFSGLFATISATMGGYVLARFRFKFSGAIILFFLITQMMPSFIGLAPLYSMLSKLGMIDWLPTLMILGTASLVPFSIITLRGFFQNVPLSIEEAAMIDGCGRFQTLLLVVLPIILPGISAVFIFGFVQAWNNLFAPVLFMNRDSNYTIPVALNTMVQKNNIRWGDLAAGAIIAITPTIFMFGLVQKYIATGLTAGAVKG